MNGLCNKLAEILEVDQVQSSDMLRDFEYWDSLTILSIVAMLDFNYNVNLTVADMARLTTIGDLVSTVENRKRK